jgi:hypothetical protein
MPEAARHYDERQLGALVLMVAITNFFNRLNTTFRMPVGTRWQRRMPGLISWASIFSYSFATWAFVSPVV